MARGWQEEHWSIAVRRGYGLNRRWLPWVNVAHIAGILRLEDLGPDLASAAWHHAPARRAVNTRAGIVQPTATASVRLRPLPHDAVRFRDGFWAAAASRNREATIPAAVNWLERAGNLANFEAAASGGTYTAGRDDSGAAFPFLDSDVYKWLEAVGWELGRGEDAGLRGDAERMIELIARAQRPDGYLNTYVQLEHPGSEFVDLQWAHELYSAGHLVQAAVAWHRTMADDRLLVIATRLVDRIEAEFGPEGRAGVDGHPEIEMALVELYRSTGERRHLDLARRFIDLRGRGLLGEGRFGAAYWQDHIPLRAAPEPMGHAVRQVYLDCGAVDVAVETGDQELLQSVIRRWEDMVATRMYLTGGIGSRHRDESFGDPFELPPDRAYAETCAAIGSVMLAWRLLLATGEPMYAEVAERTLYNAVLPGLATDGCRFFYVNPLHRRERHQHSDPGAASDARAEWFACACCPPNLMRLFASLEQQVATTDSAGVQLHQLVAADLETPHARIETRGDQPWGGRFEAVVTESVGSASWTLTVRVPGWLDASTLRVMVNGEPVQPPRPGDSLTLERAWEAGDRMTIEGVVPIRLVEPDPRIDAVRCCLAVERGPLVYCIEQADAPQGAAFADLAIDPSVPAEMIAGVDGELDVRIGVCVRESASAPLPYWPAGRPVASVRRATMRSVPYFTWCNRALGGMRTWIPIA